MNKKVVIGIVAAVGGVVAAVAGTYIYKKKKAKKYAEPKKTTTKKEEVDAEENEDDPDEEEEENGEDLEEDKVVEALGKAVSFVVEHQDEIEAVVLVIELISGIWSLVSSIKEGKTQQDINAKLDLLLRNKDKPVNDVTYRKIIFRRVA